MKNLLTSVRMVLIVVGSLVVIELLAGCSVLTPESTATPVPMPGAKPPQPGEKRGPGSHPNVPPGPPQQAQ